jgi:hypothetical protein
MKASCTFSTATRFIGLINTLGDEIAPLNLIDALAVLTSEKSVRTIWVDTVNLIGIVGTMLDKVTVKRVRNLLFPLIAFEHRKGYIHDLT